MLMKNPIRQKILDEIDAERERQVSGGPGVHTDDFDKTNTANDWIAYIIAYAGRAARRVYRNQREKQGYRENLVKTAALAVAALEAYDRGWTPSANEGV
jgi:hypothetical protein